jgi:hypothetical protein
MLIKLKLIIWQLLDSYSFGAWLACIIDSLPWLYHSRSYLSYLINTYKTRKTVWEEWRDTVFYNWILLLAKRQGKWWFREKNRLGINRNRFEWPYLARKIIAVQDVMAFSFVYSYQSLSGACCLCFQGGQSLWWWTNIIIMIRLKKLMWDM